MDISNGVCVCSQSFLVFRPKSWSRTKHFCIAARSSSSSTFKYIKTWNTVSWELLFITSPSLSHRNEWRSPQRKERGCAHIMYLTIKYPNYPIISLPTQPIYEYIATEKFEFPLWDLNSNSHHHRNSMRYHITISNGYVSV